MAQKTQRFDPRQNMRGETYEIFHYLDISTRHLEAHYHDFYEVFFFIDGDVDYWVEGDLYHLRPGDVLLIRPTELHKPIPRSEINTYERIVLWLNKNYLSDIDGGLLEYCFDADQPTFTKLLRLTSGEQKTVLSLARQLTEESHGDAYGGACCAYGLLLQLLTAVNRIAHTRDIGSHTNYRTPTFISEILTYISAHYDEELSLDRLAAHFFINKYYLSHEFKKAVGVSVHRHITLKRLHAAYDLLTEGISPGQACLRCGFSDYTAFYRAFKAEYGISPTVCGQSNT